MSLVRLHDTWRTTTFRLVLLYGIMFAVGVISLLGVIYYDTESYETRQAKDILNSELQNYLATPGEKIPETFAADIQRDSRHIKIYGLFSLDGHVLSGNAPQLPPGLAIDGEPHLVKMMPAMSLFDETTETWGVAQRLPNQKIIFLGRRMIQLDEIRHIIFKALVGAVMVIIIGTVFGILLSVRPVRRIRAMEAVSQRIIQGEISLRLPLEGSDDELDLLALIVNKMLDEIAQRMTDIKGAADSVAHNLRTPLAHLRTNLNRLLSTSNDQDIRQTLVQAIEEVDVLLVRFRALLRISEISGSMRRSMFRDVQIKVVLDNINEVYLPIAAEKNVSLRFDFPDGSQIVHGDEALLFEAFMNLVDNAVKFASINGRVDVRLLVLENAYRVEIENDGISIPADEMKLVLQPFYRSKITRDRDSGHGVGLSVVTAIMNLHGFHFSLSSGEGITRATVDCSTAIRFE